MFKLTPETLDEVRLKRSVDQSTLLLGQELLDSGKVQVHEVSDLSAVCTVGAKQDKRTHRVSMQIKGGKGQQKSMLIFQCSCPHGSRGLICEHDVAAWLGVLQYLRQNIYPAWRDQVSRLMDSITDIPQRSKEQSTPNYLLFFSLQGPNTTDTPFWKIIPYQLGMNQLPEDIRNNDLHNMANIFEAYPSLVFLAKALYFMMSPEACVNCTPESVRLANILLDRERTYTNTARFPIEDYLPLIVATNSPLYLGSPRLPFIRPLHVLNQKGDISLGFDRDVNGVYLRGLVSALIETDGVTQPITFDFSSTEVEIISLDGRWMLAENYVLELVEGVKTDLLYLFREKPVIFIPKQQTDSFGDKYLVELAQSMPLKGNAILWIDTIIDTLVKPSPRLYLSDQNGELLAQLRFGYPFRENSEQIYAQKTAEVVFDNDFPEITIQSLNDGEIYEQSTKLNNEDHKPVDTQSREIMWRLLRIHRNPEFEKEISNLLSSSHYSLKRAPLHSQPGLFRLRARTHAVDFLLNQVPRLLKDGFEIYGEEQLKTARVNRNQPSISFNVASGIDWFDVQTIVNFGELEVSLKDIRRVMRKRERFIKLADGSIGEIPEEWFEKYQNLFTLGETQEKGMRFSQHQITLIDQALRNADRINIDQAFKHKIARLHALLDSGFNGVPPHPLPQGFTGELRPYQKAGIDWLHFLNDLNFGGCLADDMGLGKTIQTLVFLQALYEQPERPTQASLLVVPRSLLVNWQREAERFTPNLRVIEFFESDRIKDIQVFTQADLVITTYGVMLRDIQFLHRYTFLYAILDESQSIKNPASQTGRAARLLRAQFRLVLTGTPIENSTIELWSQFSFLNPGLLGNLEYFKEHYSNPIERKNDEAVAHKLRRLVFPFILRRTKDQVASDLPPRSERILFCDMVPAQRKLYNRTRDYYRGLLLGLLDDQGLNSSRMKILEGLLRLRQISNHPSLFEPDFKGDSGKLELLLGTLETLLAENHKALVFSQFVQMLHLVRKELDLRQISYAYLDGHTQDRQQTVDDFQSTSTIPFFLISLKAGGLGLNLTAADYVIHIDPWWNPAVEMQASDRTHRIGQDKPVFIFKLIARDSIEEKILQLQERKRNLVDQIITTETAFFKDLTKEDIQVLFS